MDLKKIHLFKILDRKYELNAFDKMALMLYILGGIVIFVWVIILVISA